MSRVAENIFKKNLTEISGFENIPEGWEAHLIQDIFEIGRGRVISQNEINENPGNYPVYSSQSFNDGVMGTIDTFDFEGEYLTWTTDGAYAGTVFHRKGKFSCTNVCGTLKANEKKVFTKFFLYHLGKVSKRYVSYVGNPKLMNDIMANIAITVPPLPTQRKISHILSTADAVIEKTQAAIAKYKAIKQGMLHDLFTRGIDIQTGKLRPRYEDAPELYKKSKLGWIPREWDDKSLISLCSEKPTYGINAAAVDFTHQLPTYLRITDIDEDGNFSKTGRKCVDSPFSNQYILKKGDLVFARTGATVGKTYLYNEADGLLVFAGFLIKVSPNEKLLDSNFLKFLTETPYYLNWVGLMSQRSGQPGINGNEYGNFLIPNPDLNEQKIISERLLSIQNKLHTEQNYLHKLQQLKAGLMEDLLSGKKTVNLKETELA